MVQHTGAMTIEDFIRLYDTEGPFELVDGERIALSPNVSRHGVILKHLITAMVKYEETTRNSEAFMEMPFVLVEESGWVRGSRVPDLMVFTTERIAAYKAADPDWQDKPFLLVPDIAVEIISANDLYTGVQDKVENYLDDGVRVVWVINPRRKNVTVYQTIKRIEVLSGDTALTGGDVLPGFSMPLPALFA